MEAARQRDPQAFERLYALYLPRVYAYVSGRVGHRQSTEDLVADIFLKAVQALPAFQWQYEGSFAAWLFRIARNATLNYHRHRGVAEQWEEQQMRDELPAVLSEDPSPEDELLRRERADVIQRLLLSLPHRRQEIISLRFFGELRNNEIASVLGLDERTVASHLCRGLRDLHSLWLAEMEPRVLVETEPDRAEGSGATGRAGDNIGDNNG